jgi:hypothetical protein
MCEFYKYTPDQVASLTTEEFSMLWQAITILEARKALVDFQASGFPHATKSYRSKIHREMHKAAYPKLSESEAVSTEQLAKFLAGLGGS